MRRVILESPFAGATPELAARNARYLDAAMRDCLNRGESPYASHRMLTSALDDTKPDERELGIAAGFAWRKAAAATVAYVDLGVSRGMQHGFINAAKLAARQCHRGEVQHAIEFRWLRGEWRS